VKLNLAKSSMALMASFEHRRIVTAQHGRSISVSPSLPAVQFQPERKKNHGKQKSDES
jgi:hypothetical protein